MRLFPTLNSPAFFQTANQLIHFSWQAIKHNVSLLWAQPEEPSFFMSASEEAGFIQHQVWRSAFKNQLRTLRQQITQAYRAGQMLSPDKLRETLLVEQATFTSQAVSALFYDRSLKRLAQRFPHYAHALEGAANHFRDTLKSHPQKALRYFYHDIVNHLVLWSGNKITLTQLIDALSYYQTLIPMHLYQKIQTALEVFNVQTLENHVDAFHGVPCETVKALLAQINQAFTNHATKSEEVFSLQRFMQETHALARQGLNYAKQHPFQVLTTLTVATVLGYRYHSTSDNNALISAQPFQVFPPPIIMTLSALPLALRQETSFWQVAVPMMTGWLAQLELVAAQPPQRWVKSLGGANNDEGYSVQQTSDGGYIVTGYTQSFGATYDVDLWLSKWDANGTVSWVRTLGGTDSSDDGTSVQQTSDGGYIVTGYTYSVGAGNYDLWLSKWDANGTVSWVRTLGGTNNDDDNGNAVQQTSDGGYIVTGVTQSFEADDYDLWLTKWDSQGNLIWSKILGGTGDDVSYSVQQRSDGGYITTGYTKSFSFGVGGADLWLSKWDAAGNVGGNDCILQTNVSSAIPVVNSMNVNITANIPSVAAQTPTFSPQMVNPTLLTLCDDAPVLRGSGGSFTYTENDPATVIDSGIRVSDDNALVNATISISGGFVSGQDVLGFIDQNGMVGSYNSSSGRLTLIGTSSVANYQAALCSVTYQNTADNPATSLRTFSFTVSNGELSSAPVTRSATVVAVNDPPVLTGSGGSFTYTENDPPTVIDSGISVSDDNMNLANATISISGGFASGQDVLGFIDQNGITGSYNPSTGVLTLSGMSSVVNYQTVLRNVTYQNTVENPLTGLCIFSFIANDGTLSSVPLICNATVVAVDDAPVLTHNQLSITQGATVILADNNLKATDVDTGSDNLQWTISALQHGQFEALTAPGIPMTTFNQSAITDGTIRFVHDGSDQAPSYQVSVSDGFTATPPTAATVDFTLSPIPLIAGLASGAGVLSLCILGTSLWCVKRRQRLAKAQLQANNAEMGIEMVEGIRKEKGHTVIYGKQSHYALLNKIKTKEAQALLAQTGIEVTFPDGKNKAKFELGRGQFGKLRLAKITAIQKAGIQNAHLKMGHFVGVKKIKGGKRNPAIAKRSQYATQTHG